MKSKEIYKEIRRITDEHHAYVDQMLAVAKWIKSEFMPKRSKQTFFNPKFNKPKPSPDDVTFSVDVLIIDENELHGVACYSFEDEKWIFHTDTLVDYDEVGHETQWRWYYPTFTKEDVNF